MFSGDLSLTRTSESAWSFSSHRIEQCDCCAPDAFYNSGFNEWRKTIGGCTYILLANWFSRGEESAKSIKGQDETLISGHFFHFSIFISLDHLLSYLAGSSVSALAFPSAFGRGSENSGTTLMCTCIYAK